MKLLHFLRDVMKEESTFTVNKAKVHNVKSNEVIVINDEEYRVATDK